jgi:hypothetical protein
MLWGCTGGVGGGGGIGGIGGGGGGDLWAGGGNGGTGVHIGSVSKFGSVFVNDTEFDTASAVVIIDGEEAGSGDQVVLDRLAVGKVVRIEGTSQSDGTGTADRVVYNEDIVGPVETVTAIDADTRSLLVLGQTVVVDASTRLVGTTLAEIAAGNLLEVSGFADDLGSIRAGFIEKLADSTAPGTEVELRGFAASVDTVMRTFRVNRLAVDYAAADVSAIPGGEPSNGQYLEIKGTLDSGGRLVARIVMPEDLLGTDNAEFLEISGIVTAFTSAADFEVNGIAVSTGEETAFQGILSEEIGAGTRLTVSGPLENRVLQADRVKASAEVRLESDAASATDEALTFEGLEGVTVQANELTKILGAADSLGAIQPGYHVKVFGSSFSPGTVTASKLIVMEKPKKKVELKGPVEEVSNARLTVLGVAIGVEDLPENGCRLDDGTRLSPAEFVGHVEPGDVITAGGNRKGGGDPEWDSLVLDRTD